MSHFAGLVILTPEYLDNHDLDESLERYSEQLEVLEYSRGKVSNYEKICFIDYYNKKCFELPEIIKKHQDEYFNELVDNGIVEPFKSQEESGFTKDRYIFNNVYDRKDDYAEWLLKKYPNYLDNFAKMYHKYGKNWNSNSWKMSYDSKEWEEYSTYNPDSVYDWYSIGGRWDNSIKTKTDEYVNECYLNEIDWTDFTDDDYEDEEKENIFGEKYKPLKDGVKWHFTKSNIPYTLFVDGIHYSQGEMGWFGMSKDDMTDDEWKNKFFEIIGSLPEDSQVSLVDFHI